MFGEVGFRISSLNIRKLGTNGRRSGGDCCLAHCATSLERGFAELASSRPWGSRAAGRAAAHRISSVTGRKRGKYTGVSSGGESEDEERRSRSVSLVTEDELSTAEFGEKAEWVVNTQAALVAFNQDEGNVEEEVRLGVRVIAPSPSILDSLPTPPPPSFSSSSSFSVSPSLTSSSSSSPPTSSSSSSSSSSSASSFLLLLLLLLLLLFLLLLYPCLLLGLSLLLRRFSLHLPPL